MTTTTTVSQLNLDRCSRILDENANEYFYLVQSESDDTQEYEVRFVADKGYFCSCPSGQNGFANCKAHKTCKHVRWSKAHARAVKAEQAEQSQIEAYVRQGVSRDEATRIVYAQGPQYTEQDIKQAQYLNQREAFSILR